MGSPGRIAILVGIAMLLLAPTALADSQTWYLEEKEHPTVQNGVLEMVRGAPNDDTGTVTVPAGDCQLWAASETALADVEYDENGWSGTFDVQDGDANTDIDYEAHLGHTDPSAATTLAVDGRVTFTEADPQVDAGTIEIAYPESPEGATFQVPEDHYLTYRFCVPTSQPDATVLTDGHATLTSPSGSTSYPTPELGSLPLAAAGLLGLALVGRRRLEDA